MDIAPEPAEGERGACCVAVGLVGTWARGHVASRPRLGGASEGACEGTGVGTVDDCGDGGGNGRGDGGGGESC